MAKIPAWLNKEFLEKALNSHEESNLKVVSSEITEATAPGDNYASHIYRAAVKISTNGLEDKKSFIIKTELTNPELKKMVSEMNVFQREINAFTHAIPQLQNLIEKNAPENYRPYAAKCYYTCIDPCASVLVLEDLKVPGFRLANPSQVLDTKHCFLVVKTLAIYHAASVVLNGKTSNKLGQMFKDGTYSESSMQIIEKVFKPTLKNLITEARNWPECTGEIVNKLCILETKTSEYLIECVNRNDNDLRVLAHMDAWVNNLMFRYSENDEVVDVRFVDFQTCQWASPVIDLLYFIHVNASIDHMKNPQIILDEYYKTLKETFTLLKYDNVCPTREYIYEQYEKRCKFGVIVGLVGRAALLMDRTDAPKLENVLNDEIFLKFTESYRKDAKEMLCIFHERGWL